MKKPEFSITLDTIEGASWGQMFDIFPDTIFWIKNLRHEFIYVNQAFIDHHGATSTDAVLGKTDHDFSPKHLANQYLKDDKKIHLGAEITERLEANIRADGNMHWYATTKKPLFNANNQIVGSYGITRIIEKSNTSLPSLAAVRLPVEYIEQHYQDSFSIQDLAHAAHLSVSALERRFRKHLHKSPNAFINEFRLEKARRLLQTTALPIVEICESVGFSDHSYFSKQFKRHFGYLPSALRKQDN